MNERPLSPMAILLIEKATNGRDADRDLFELGEALLTAVEGKSQAVAVVMLCVALAVTLSTAPAAAENDLLMAVGEITANRLARRRARGAAAAADPHSLH